MNILEKSSCNKELRPFLDIELGQWNPVSAVTRILWPTFATQAKFLKNYWVRHAHREEFVICHIVQGSIQVTSGEKLYIIHAGETAFIPPGPHSLKAMEKNTVHRSVAVGGYLLHLLLKKLSLDQCMVTEDFMTPEYEEMFQEIIMRLEKQDPADCQRLSVLAYSVLMYASRWGYSDEYPQELQKCQRYIQQNLFQRISLEDLCHEVSCRTSKLSSLFRQYTGYTPMQYIIHERIGYAMELLSQNPKMTVKQAASVCGYQNQLYFANDFRKHTGKSPSEYRDSEASKA